MGQILGQSNIEENCPAGRVQLGSRGYGCETGQINLLPTLPLEGKRASEVLCCSHFLLRASQPLHSMPGNHACQA